MSIGLAAATLGGLLGYALFSRIRMPGLLGMLLAGIVLGPYGLNLIHHELIAVSADLREMALIIILLRAGLEMSFSTIAQVGRTALLMSLLPASFELLGVIILAPKLLGVSTLEAAIGLGLVWFFGRVHIRDTVKALTIISLAIVMVWLESLLAPVCLCPTCLPSWQWV